MKKYDIESAKLVLAIEIAIEAWEKFPDEIVRNQKQAIDVMQEWKAKCLNPEKEYSNLTSLKYKKQDLLSLFNKGTGPKIDYFWARIRAEGIDYERADLLQKIFKKGKITNRIEYEYAQDNIGFAQQDGRITSEQALSLGKWIDQFSVQK